ncbi:MAG: L,D-transpeptidase family protein [Methyloceanibacter sp.]|uniref:L,D-transpeptidase family protein n=1 Tax=Methyloceanibacter sp. TaxID=1965321 RepID=UPI003EE21B89
MRVRRSRPIVVRRAPGRSCQARVQLGTSVRKAAIGRGSVKPLKREGDGGTPLGRFPVRLVLYRSDRIPRPRTSLPVRAIRPEDGWCDDPMDRNYNRLVRLPSKRSAEGLMRDDRLYDLILVLGYNDRPRIRGKGSAIFVHLARDGYTPTEGCVALSRRDLLAVLAEIKSGTTVLITR